MAKMQVDLCKLKNIFKLLSELRKVLKLQIKNFYEREDAVQWLILKEVNLDKNLL
jgi:hypothetical protein